MPLERVLADSGVFIAIFDANDTHHELCRGFLERYRGRLLTTWQVLTEALAMLDGGAQEQLLTWLDRAVKGGLLEIECTAAEDLGRALELTKKYRDQPMDFADASLYLLALRSGVRKIATIDRRDFLVYRLPGKQHFENVLD